ncbi:MAG TPA: hypothetical protein VIB48_05085 [Acidimicrobiia bacterium]
MTDDDDRLEPSALTATTFTAVGPRPTFTVTDQVPSAPTVAGAPLTVTRAPGDPVPEIWTAPEPALTVLTMLTFAEDRYIGCSLPVVVVDVAVDGGTRSGPGVRAPGSCVADPVIDRGVADRPASRNSATPPITTLTAATRTTRAFQRRRRVGSFWTAGSTVVWSDHRSDRLRVLRGPSDRR